MRQRARDFRVRAVCKSGPLGFNTPRPVRRPARYCSNILLMPDQPLQPFALPSVLLSRFSDMLPPGLVVEIVLFTVLAFWALYTLIAIYHWLKYSHASVIAIPAIAVHLGISFLFISY